MATHYIATKCYNINNQEMEKVIGKIRLVTVEETTLGGDMNVFIKTNDLSYWHICHIIWLKLCCGLKHVVTRVTIRWGLFFMSLMAAQGPLPSLTHLILHPSDHWYHGWFLFDLLKAVVNVGSWTQGLRADCDIFITSFWAFICRPISKPAAYYRWLFCLINFFHNQ